MRLNNARKWACDRLKEDADFGKKIIFSDEVHFDLGGKIVAFGVQKTHTYTLKSSHCLVRILVQMHNRAIFLRKWARRGHCSQWRSLSGHVEWIFVQKNWRGGYWQHLVSTGRRYMPHSLSYTRCFAPSFWRLLYQPQSWFRLATSELRFATVVLLFVWHRQR